MEYIWSGGMCPFYYCFALSSEGNAHSGRSQLSFGKANQTARCRSPSGKELKPSTNSHENETFWKQVFLVPTKPSGGCSLIKILQKCNSQNGRKYLKIFAKEATDKGLISKIYKQLMKLRAFLEAQMVESACSAGAPGSLPGSGRSPGEGNGNPAQYSCWRILWTESLAGYSQ